MNTIGDLIKDNPSGLTNSTLEVNVPNIIEECGNDIFDIIATKTNTKYNESWLLSPHEQVKITDNISLSVEAPNKNNGGNSYTKIVTYNVLVAKTNGNSRESQFEALEVFYHFDYKRYLKHGTIQQVSDFHVLRHDAGQGVVFAFRLEVLINGRKESHITTDTKADKESDSLADKMRNDMKEKATGKDGSLASLLKG